jgi:hypothetical protein
VSDRRSIGRSQIFLAVGAVVLVWTVIGLLPLAASTDWATRGQFGDMFGAANALFSALAFGGVIVTVLLQREELALQRQELEDTRKELARAAAAQEASQANLAKQAEALETSARLSALRSMLEYYGTLQAHTQSQARVRVLQDKQNQIAERLEWELKKLTT